MGLPERDEVGNEVVPREAPHPGSQPTESRLHLVGDEQAARRAHGCDRVSEARDVGPNAVRREDRVDDQGGGPNAGRIQLASASRTSEAKSPSPGAGMTRTHGASESMPPSDGEIAAISVVTP